MTSNLERTIDSLNIGGHQNGVRSVPNAVVSVSAYETRVLKAFKNKIEELMIKTPQSLDSLRTFNKDLGGREFVDVLNSCMSNLTSGSTVSPLSFVRDVRTLLYTCDELVKARPQPQHSINRPRPGMRVGQKPDADWMLLNEYSALVQSIQHINVITSSSNTTKTDDVTSFIDTVLPTWYGPEYRAAREPCTTFVNVGVSRKIYSERVIGGDDVEAYISDKRFLNSVNVFGDVLVLTMHREIEPK